MLRGGLERGCAMAGARVVPALDQLELLPTPLNAGELATVGALAQLGSDWHVFVQARLATAQPDFVVVHPDKGVWVIEVKDWNPSLYRPVRNGRSDRAHGSHGGAGRRVGQGPGAWCGDLMSAWHRLGKLPLRQGINLVASRAWNRLHHACSDGGVQLPQDLVTDRNVSRFEVGHRPRWFVR